MKCDHKNIEVVMWAECPCCGMAVELEDGTYHCHPCNLTWLPEQVNVH